LTALGHLSAYIEAEASFRLIDGNDARSIRGSDGVVAAVVLAHCCAAGSRRVASAQRAHSHTDTHTH